MVFHACWVILQWDPDTDTFQQISLQVQVCYTGLKYNEITHLLHVIYLVRVQCQS